MTKRKLLTAIIGLALFGVLQGCSSGDLSDGEIQGDEAPPADAATDPVPPAGDVADLDKVAAATPEDGLEQPPPDPNAAPPDPNAAPPDPGAVPPETPPDNVTPPPTVAEAPPAPPEEPKDTTPPPAEHREVANHDNTEYTVVAGDTLMKIAFEHYGDLYKWKEIFELNRDKISNPNSIPKGTVLKLNPAGEVTISHNGEKYLIKSGDTLGTIARDVYGTSSKWKKIWKNNRELIKDPNRIFAGFYLYYTIDDGDSPRVRSRPVAKKQDSGGEEAPAGGDAPREPASASAPAPAPAPATPPTGNGQG